MGHFRRAIPPFFSLGELRGAALVGWREGARINDGWIKAGSHARLGDGKNWLGRNSFVTYWTVCWPVSRRRMTKGGIPRRETRQAVGSHLNSGVEKYLKAELNSLQRYPCLLVPLRIILVVPTVSVQWRFSGVSVSGPFASVRGTDMDKCELVHFKTGKRYFLTLNRHWTDTCEPALMSGGTRDYRSTLTTTEDLALHARRWEATLPRAFHPPSAASHPRCPVQPTLICSESPVANNGGITGCLLWIEIPVNFRFVGDKRGICGQPDAWRIPWDFTHWLLRLKDTSCFIDLFLGFVGKMSVSGCWKFSVEVRNLFYLKLRLLWL